MSAPIVLTYEDRLEGIVEVWHADPAEADRLLAIYAEELRPRMLARELLKRLYAPRGEPSATPLKDWAAFLRSGRCSPECHSAMREGYAALASDRDVTRVEREVGLAGLATLRALDTPELLDRIEDLARANGHARYENEREHP
jgi:hypothetical protein